MLSPTHAVRTPARYDDRRNDASPSASLSLAFGMIPCFLQTCEEALVVDNLT